MDAKYTPISRKGLVISRTSTTEIRPGGIFKYVGADQGYAKRLPGYVLVHKNNPEYKMLKREDGFPAVAYDMTMVEALPQDYCLFWVEKADLRSLTLTEHQEALTQMGIEILPLEPEPQPELQSA
ncbi:MAG: hypothetical protein HC840_23335 [Leptolyngbyaceae cyanobacterium RM2_2_4]|nr:hypothetical protein [Leptolyngbyaceae cyanobacterium SM1_4_3]NJO51854.1 hypothetical protein [Leptolyngbyaceae cyanobacterium RM2_2_4]